MVAVRRIPYTTLDSVANHRTTSKVRNIDPEFVAQVVFDQIIVKIAVSVSNNTFGLNIEDLHEGNSWLDKGEGTIHVDIQDLCHVLAHIKAYASGNSRCSASVSNVSTDAERPDGYLEFVAESHDSLYIGYIARSDDSRANKVLFWSDVVHLESL